MKTLSVRQPYAGLIVSGQKRIENRSWSTHYRGRFLIHPSGRGTGPGPRGAIIGSVELVDDLTPEEALRRFPGQAQHIFGPRCWVLAKPQPCEPIPCKGKLNLWGFTP